MSSTELVLADALERIALVLQEASVQLRQEGLSQQPVAAARGYIGTGNVIDYVISEVSRTLRVPVKEIEGRSRNKSVITARHTCWFILRKATKLSYADIALLVGNVNHSTVVHAINKMPLRQSQDPELYAMTQRILVRTQAMLASPGDT
jgi:chromosomal replication initiation ATPase DnaA